MKVNFKFLCSLLLLLSIIGCSSKDTKKQDDVKTPEAATSTTAIKDFDRPVPPVMMTNNQDRAAYMITHYWDKFNFRDTMYCHAPQITEQAFSNYLTLFPYATREKRSDGVKKLMEYAIEDVVMYNYFYKMAERYLYEPNSQFRNDEFFIPFLEHVVSSPKVREEDKIRPRFLLELAYKNRPGEKALNINYTMYSGQTGTLYGISAKYTLMMFFSPDCTQCRNLREQMKSSPVLTQSISSGNLKILAIYPDQDLEVWRKYKDEIPSTWINGYDRSLSVREKQIYDLKAIPTLYLLDSNKNVIMKDATFEAVNQYIAQNP
jgi:hypothetical protein